MAKTPYFFKIILEDAIQEGKLGIPKKFVRRYGNYLQEWVFLKVPSGAKWHVELVKSGVDIWLGNGWRHFVDYYSLSHGSFLIFGFEDFKSCTFSVLIFDKTASEIDYPFNAHGHNEEQVQQSVIQENNGVDVLPTRISEDKSPLSFSRPCKKMKQENCRTQSEEFHQLVTPKLVEVDVSPPQKREHKSMSRISRPRKKMKQEIDTGLLQAKRGDRDRVVKRTLRLSAEEKANALDRAHGYYKSNNLRFSMVVQPTHVGGDFRVAIPTRFAKKYFKEQRGNIILISVDEKTWSVEYICAKQCGRKVARVCRGWRKFVEDNHLEVGDVCVFEVINHNATKLKVVICRETQDANASAPIEGRSMSPFSRTWKKMKQDIDTRLPQVKRGDMNGVVKRTQRLTAEEIAKALDRANSYYKSNNHSFSMVLHPTHVRGDFRMVIPYSFAKKYFREQRGNISLNSVDEKTWSVEYIYSKKRRYKEARIYRGWRKFVEDNHLVVGDVCVFEVINYNGSELKVVISRENQDAYANPPIGNKQRLNRTEIP